MMYLRDRKSEIRGFRAVTEFETRGHINLIYAELELRLWREQ